MKYPAAPRSDQVDDFHGTAVVDPYRPLEDLDAPETKQWVDAQNVLTESYLKQIPYREKIRSRLTELWDHPRSSLPFKRAGRYFQYKNSGLQNQSILYYKDGIDGVEKVALDPNQLSEDGTVALSSLDIHKDGKLVAYGISRSGSDWVEYFVRDIDSGKDLDDHLQWVKFSEATWHPDGSGFYYARYPEPKTGDEYEDVNVNQKLYFHKLGTPQIEDELIYEDSEHPQYGFSASVTEDEQFLILTVWAGTENKNLLYIRPLESSLPFRPVVDEWIGEFSVIGHEDQKLYVMTTYEAPLGKIITIDTQFLKPESWTTIIPESDVVLRSVGMIDHHLFATYRRDVVDEVNIYDFSGAFLHSMTLPDLGSVNLSGRYDDPEIFYQFTSYLYPSTIFQYDYLKDISQLYEKSNIDFDPSKYESKRIFYESKDGTRVPMFIIHKKGIIKNGNNPTYLYGYGGFNISLTPGFSFSRLVWLEHGGIYAVPNLRGGGEYGETWHEAGMLAHKQNVFDDFISAAEYLIDEGYTSPSKLAIGGGSNGGLLVSAVMMQRPDLFGTVNCDVPVADMLRYHKFTIGWAWVNEYGSADVADQFPYLYAYSPLHNVIKGEAYPPIMITTGDHDDRVVPSHSFKLIATLQEKNGSKNPMLIRIETDGGHGAGLPTEKAIAKSTDVWSFLLYSLGENWTGK
ncbi:MAG: prolyl oligopeptidase family protein [Fidelibacterota bacterium]